VGRDVVQRFLRELAGRLAPLDGFLARKGSTSALFMMAAFSVSITARKGGTGSPLFSATCT